MQFLFRPVPIYPLAYFRIAFGLLMLLEGIGALVTGWVQKFYVEPTFHFRYIGLEWLHPLPGQGMVWVYVAQSVVGVLILLGLYYRTAAVVFFLLFGFSFWCEKTHYLNHHYLVWLVSGLMIFLPAHRYASVDARRNPALKTEWMAYWPLFLLRLQLVIVYFYAGLAKLQTDWLAGRPLRLWFEAKAHVPVIGQYLATEPAVMFTAWSGMLFDLLVAWALLYKPTRWPAFAAAVLFHVFNAVVFQIGVFPWFMILATLLFFEPQQIARWFFRKKLVSELPPADAAIAGSHNKLLITGLLATYAVFQLAFPLRHHLIPEDVTWTEEGHRYSWRMMLRAKSGSLYYTIIDPATGQRFTEFPDHYLTRDQQSDLTDHPDMIWQFAQHLKEQYRQKGHTQVQIFAHSQVSLNGHPQAPLVTDTVDLAAIDYKWGRKPWVTARPAVAE